MANSSAAVANGNVFTVLLSDQPNACQQYGHFPTRTWTTLTLVLATGTTSPTVGTVVPQQGVPGPGQVVGELVQATADLPPTANLDANDGTVTWKSNTDFSVTLQSVDVGFEGTTDRLMVQSIGVPSCIPQSSRPPAPGGRLRSGAGRAARPGSGRGAGRVMTAVSSRTYGSVG